ncbi:MAG: flagellar hook-associated protein FlgL [Lachnospiraceae bacterium]|nr:flagellar hook-associated protein FlgL [Lachnospiraceae bacterium]
MRVTNGMMRNNSLLNIQKNKILENKYMEQYSTGKKIQRPSDNPTIAVRALQYRTTLVDVKQYLSNIKDATGFMNETENALRNMNGRIEEMVTYCTQAANGTYNAEDRADIVTQLKQYASYIYEQNANQDYAGRYLFTGYRTDVPLLFTADQSDTTYTITENLDINKIKKYNYVYGQAEYDDAKSDSDYAAEASQFEATHRILLSYDDCDKDGNDVTLTYTDKYGNTQTITAVTKSIGDDTTYNEHLHPGEDEVYYVPETGELVFGDNVYDDIRAGKDLSVTYQKTNFEKNDVRPEHYFSCTAVNNVTGVEALYKNAGTQTINYQINFGQLLTVNTEACNAISLAIKRTIEDIENICNDIDVIETNLTSVKKRIADCDETDTETLTNLKELQGQIETELALQKTVLTNALAGAITVCQDTQDDLNIAISDHGSRYARMTMTETKLEEMKLDTEDAKIENEGADIEEAMVHFTEADLLYMATLHATSQILGQSLLDFI